jgi:hypothetical protein
MRRVHGRYTTRGSPCCKRGSCGPGAQSKSAPTVTPLADVTASETMEFEPFPSLREGAWNWMFLKDLCPGAVTPPLKTPRIGRGAEATSNDYLAGAGAAIMGVIKLKGLKPWVPFV